MIDDIDRLNENEITLIMQMVKTVGKLPNIVYLLAYDREIVWSSLKSPENNQHRRPSYAEKIIQHEIELPIPSRYSLLKMLDQEIQNIPPLPQNSTRYSDMIISGIHRWIRTPRDVFRMANALNFSWSAMQNEIDPQDLICMEGIRIFDRKIFDWIRQNRDFFLREGRFQIDSEEQQREVRDSLNSILIESEKENILNLICNLFPNKSKNLRNDNLFYTDEPWHQTVSRNGMAKKFVFDSYFRLSPVATAISKSLVDRAMNNLEEIQVQLSCLREAIDKKDENQNSLLPDYIMELQYRFEGFKTIGRNSQIAALAQIYEEAEKIDYDFGVFLHPIRGIHFLSTKILGKMGPDLAEECLRNLLLQDIPVTSKAAFIIDRAREVKLVDDNNSSPDKPIIPLARLEPMIEDVLIQITQAANTGKLEEATSYFNAVKLWSYLGDANAAIIWLNNTAQSSGKNLAKITKGMLTYSEHQKIRHYSLQSKPDEKMYDLYALREAALKFHTHELLDDDRKRIEALLEGINKFI